MAQLQGLAAHCMRCHGEHSFATALWHAACGLVQAKLGRSPCADMWRDVTIPCAALRPLVTIVPGRPSGIHSRVPAHACTLRPAQSRKNHVWNPLRLPADQQPHKHCLEGLSAPSRLQPLCAPASTCREDVSNETMRSLGLDAGTALSAAQRFQQVAAELKRRDRRDRQEQQALRRQARQLKRVGAATGVWPPLVCTSQPCSAAGRAATASGQSLGLPEHV